MELTAKDVEWIQVARKLDNGSYKINTNIQVPNDPLNMHHIQLMYWKTLPGKDISEVVEFYAATDVEVKIRLYARIQEATDAAIHRAEASPVRGSTLTAHQVRKAAARRINRTKGKKEAKVIDIGKSKGKSKGKTVKPTDINIDDALVLYTDACYAVQDTYDDLVTEMSREQLEVFVVSDISFPEWNPPV